MICGKPEFLAQLNLWSIPGKSIGMIQSGWLARQSLDNLIRNWPVQFIPADLKTLRK
jgi:hypothetical protein